MSWDPYLDLEHGVLRNLLAITHPVELAQVEAELTALRLVELHQSPLPGRYDLAHLQAIHHYLFQDVYDWAGQLRSVGLGKDGRLFCPPQLIEPRAVQLFLGLAARDHLQGLGREAFGEAAADLLAVVNELHPFREGNGRIQRVFLADLARRAGYELRWATMGSEENITAAKAAIDGDRGPLRALLARLLAP